MTRADLEAAMKALDEKLWAEFEHRLADTTRELLEYIDRKVAEPRPLDLAGIQAAIDGALADLQVVGKSRTAFGHQHLVELRVTRKE